MKQYFVRHTHIIDGVNFRKFRLPNVHLLTALMTGHFTRWRSTLYFKKGKEENLHRCPFCYDIYDEYCLRKTGPCVCNLDIPGVVPKDRPVTSEHFDFLRFLNKLARHEMFEMFKKDSPYPIREEELYVNDFKYDGTQGCLNAWTDGSAKDGRTGWAVWYESVPGLRITSTLYGHAMGKQTNNRAELTALIKATNHAATKFEGPLHIKTDSAYSIQALNMYRRRKDVVVNSALLQSEIVNFDLIRALSDAIDRYPNKVFISKVRAHVGIEGNEKADAISKFARELYIID